MWFGLDKSIMLSAAHLGILLLLGPLSLVAQPSGGGDAVRDYDGVIRRLFGNPVDAVRGSGASIFLSIQRPHSTDLQISVQIDSATATITSYESTECIESALGIAESKGPEVLRREFERLANGNPRKTRRPIDKKIAGILFDQGLRASGGVSGRVARAKESFFSSAETVYAGHAPIYHFELESGGARIGWWLTGPDFEDTVSEKDAEPLALIRRLVSLSVLRSERPTR